MRTTERAIAARSLFIARRKFFVKKSLLGIWVVTALMQFAVAQNAESTAKFGFSFSETRE